MEKDQLSPKLSDCVSETESDVDSLEFLPDPLPPVVLVITIELSSFQPDE